MNEELKNRIFDLRDLYQSNKIKFTKEAKDKQKEAEEADKSAKGCDDKLAGLKEDAKKLGIDL